MVEISEVTRRFGDITAVQAVSLSVGDGEIFGLLGPNGAGKTTLLNLLTGQLSPDGGEVRIGDFDVRRQTQDVRRIIGLVPQDLAIYPDVSARENVAFFGRLYGLWGKPLHEAVAAALEFVGLSDVGKRLPKTYSGGMRRRLNIACGIVHSPRLVLMDEPTVGIDPQSRDHILRSVEQLNRDGSTIIYTSHYMEEVERICSRIAILDHGKVIADGSLRDLTSLVHDTTTAVVTLREPVAIEEDALLGIEGVRTVAVSEYKVTVTSDTDAYNFDRVLHYFTSRNIALRGVTMDEPSLETVFLSLTGRTLRDGAPS
jgi:linearmycin/streptolysin S transport system ATP-binding protein